MPLTGSPYDEIIRETVVPFFDALKHGDVKSIKKLVAGDMYEDKRVLLEQNKDYPDFLRKYYQGVEFIVKNIASSGDHIVIDIGIKYPSGDEINAQLYLSDISATADMSEEVKWKIVEFRQD